MLKTVLWDPFNKFKARITNTGALLTQTENVVAIAPDPGTQNRQRYLFGTLGSTGLSSGSIAQNVDGSVTPQKFYMQASEEFDLHIMQITVVISDVSAQHSKFGAIPALTNGWDLVWNESGVDTYLIQKAKTTGQALVQSGFSDMFGNSNTASILPSFDGNSDAVVVNFAIHKFVPNGVRIGRGTTDKLTSVINDNLTALDGFSVYISGYKNYPIESV